MISGGELLAFSKEGFWPGPQENETDFLQRVVATKSQSCQHSQDAISGKILEDACTLTESLYDFSGKQIPCSYQDKDLALWEGAALWIEEENGVSTPRIQLKRKFRKGSYLFYKVEEVLAHEMLHAARIAYEEPKYEEILAYKTSKNSLRRVLGPLFQEPKESFIFILLLLIGLVLEIVSVLWDFPFYIPWILLPFLWIGGLGLRLSSRFKKFNKALRQIKAFIPEPSKALAVLSRLTDEEIEELSQIATDKIRPFFKQKTPNDLRMRSLVLRYFT